MRNPASAAQAAAMTKLRTSSTGTLETAPLSMVTATMPVKAPTLMKPAWPRDSSPEIPTTRLRETAMHT